MFDAIEMEKRGVPTVTIAHDTFLKAAHLHARVLGLEEIAIVVEPAPDSGVVGEDVGSVADATFGEVVAALTNTAGAAGKGGDR